MNDDLTTFGARFKHARKLRGYSQQDIADNCGLSRPSISQWEKQPSATVDATAIYKTCQFLKINQKWLLFGEGNIDEIPLTKASSPTQLLSISIIEWSEIEEFITAPTAEKFKNRPTSGSLVQLSEQSFAVKLPHDIGSTLLEGDILCADASKKAKHGDTVLAKKSKSSDIILGELLMATSRNMIVPLSPSITSFPVQSDTNIIAVIMYKPYINRWS